MPTVVEVKRSSDTRIRREVVGQMLEYAANAVLYWPVETLRAQFEADCQVRGINPDEQLAEFLGPDADAPAFWQQVKTNLQAGKIRLLFVGDEIPSELRRMVEFLNKQMDPAEVLAVEIKQFVGENLRTLVPSVIGQTEEAQQRKATGPAASRQWDEQSFLEELSRKSPPAEVDAARRLFEWANRKTLANQTVLSWGTGPKEGSFSASVRFNGGYSKLFMIYTFGSIETYFAPLASKPPFDHEPKRRELLDKVNRLLDKPILTENLAVRRLIKLESLTDNQKLARFLEVIEWVLNEIKNTRGSC